MRTAILTLVAALGFGSFAFAADLELRKFAEIDFPLVPSSGTGFPTVLRPGDRIIYYLQVTNRGPETATNVVITDPLPPRVVFDVLFPSARTNCTAPALGQPGTVTCTLPSLATGARKDIFFTARLPLEDSSFEPIVNTATVTSATSDPNLANNVASAVLRVEPTVPISREALVALAVLIAAAAMWALRGRL